MSDIDKYKLDEALKTIKHYQKWRRGDEELEQPHPQAIGHALDKLIALADAVLGEPSEKMLKEIAYAARDFDSHEGIYPRSNSVYKAMRDQMLKELK